MRRFLREYRVEIIALILAALGVFLLTEQLEIRKSLREAWFELVKALKELRPNLKGLLDASLSRVSLSDFIGVILLIFALLFIVWRVRYRFQYSELWRATACPKCGSELHRIRRTALDRLLSKTLLPHARRYLCSNPDCRWSGLRRIRG